MNGRNRLTDIFIVLLLLTLTVLPAVALGNKEAGVPEPVDVKDASETPVETSSVPAVATPDSDYPPQGWVTDIREAYKLAQAGDKQILLNFTGSDWCVWCKKLSKEVFTTPEFQAYADENLVLLFLDFPNSIALPDEQVRHNQIVSQLLGVKGYPAIWLLDSDLSPLLATGYREGGAVKYIAHLKNDRPDITDEERENFRAGFTEAIEVNIGPLE